MQNLFPRLLGVLGIHATFGALYWVVTKYVLVAQDSLSAQLLERIEGDPLRVGVYLGDVTGDFLTAAIGALVVSAVLAGVWLVMVHLNPPYGDQSALARRGSWAGLLVLALVATAALFWFKVLGNAVAELLAPGVGIKGAIIGAVFVLLAYWLSTVLFATRSSMIAVPGALLIRR